MTRARDLADSGVVINHLDDATSDIQTQIDAAVTTANAAVNPTLISQSEAEAGVAVTERTFNAERVAQAIAAQSTGAEVAVAMAIALGG